MIRILAVDDSALFHTLLDKAVESEPEIEIVARASDGKEALYQVRKYKPDLVTMDIFMPGLDGIKAIEEIMAYSPVPILVISSVVSKEHANNAVRALGAGAVDILEKPSDGEMNEFSRVLQEKCRLLAGISVITHPRARLTPIVPHFKTVRTRAVAIGASTGGPGAVHKILSHLPENLPAPVLIVQHITQGFAQSLADWFQGATKIPVRVARDGELAKPGQVIVAADDHHLTIARGGRISLTTQSSGNGHRPSVDTLMKSVAEASGAKAIGVLLTGMGRDGAQGMRAIHKVGGRTITQDEASSVVFGMPQAAAELGAVDKVLPLPKIAAAILEEFED